MVTGGRVHSTWYCRALWIEGKHLRRLRRAVVGKCNRIKILKKEINWMLLDRGRQQVLETTEG
jgi:hypothetical protein